MMKIFVNDNQESLLYLDLKDKLMSLIKDNIIDLSHKKQLYIMLYLKGHTYSEIGRLTGTSRSNIHKQFNAKLSKNKYYGILELLKLKLDQNNEVLMYLEWFQQEKEKLYEENPS